MLRRMRFIRKGNVYKTVIRYMPTLIYYAEIWAAIKEDNILYVNAVGMLKCVCVWSDGK